MRVFRTRRERASVPKSLSLASLSGSSVLFVGDKPPPMSFDGFKGRLEAIFASSAAEAQRLLEIRSASVSLVVVDLRIGDDCGVELLSVVRKSWPLMRRVLTTGSADTDTLIAAINKSAVHRVLLKPYSLVNLHRIIQEELTAFAHARRRTFVGGHPLTAIMAHELSRLLAEIDRACAAIQELSQARSGELSSWNERIVAAVDIAATTTDFFSELSTWEPVLKRQFAHFSVASVARGETARHIQPGQSIRVEVDEDFHVIGLPGLFQQMMSMGSQLSRFVGS